MSRIFWFVEKEDIPFAIERDGGRIFRMDGRSMAKWFEITDSDNCCRIKFNASEISESEALLLANELAEDIALLRDSDRKAIEQGDTDA